MKLSVIATSVLLAAVSTGAYAYTPGTYTAAIAGQNGPVKVEVTTSADKILSVKIVDQKETEGIGSKAVAALPAEIVKAVCRCPRHRRRVCFFCCHQESCSGMPEPGSGQESCTIGSQERYI